jgi:hypothetical protein
VMVIANAVAMSPRFCTSVTSLSTSTALTRGASAARRAVRTALLFSSNQLASFRRMAAKNRTCQATISPNSFLQPLQLQDA